MTELKLWISANYELISVLFGVMAALGVLSAIAYRWYTVRAAEKDRLKVLEISGSKFESMIEHLDNRVDKISDICAGEITEVRALTMLIGELRQDIGRIEGAFEALRVK